MAPRGSAKEVVSLETCNSSIVVFILRGNVAMEDAVVKANNWTLYIDLKNCLNVVHLENIATLPPITP